MDEESNLHLKEQRQTALVDKNENRQWSKTVIFNNKEVLNSDKSNNDIHKYRQDYL